MAGPDDWNSKIIEEFRANGGEVRAFREQPLLLLTHVGARSGATRTNPLAYFDDDDRYVIVASKAGAPTKPDRYHSLLADPSATVEVGNRDLRRHRRGSFTTRARDTLDDDAERNPAFAEYEEATERTIPVIVLRRVGGS